MTNTPKPKKNAIGLPPPAPDDYSDELTEEHWERLRAETEKYQCQDGELVSGEPW